MLGKKRKVKRTETDAVSGITTVIESSIVGRCTHHVDHTNRLKEVETAMAEMKKQVADIAARHKLMVAILGFAGLSLGAIGSFLGTILTPVILATLKAHGY